MVVADTTESNIIINDISLHPMLSYRKCIVLYIDIAEVHCK